MKGKLGTALIVLGLTMILSAIGLWGKNMAEQTQAAEASAEVMPLLVKVINQRQTESRDEPEILSAAETVPESLELAEVPVKQMPVEEINGYGYVGFLSIPAIGLELPVMANWSYTQLNIAPCRFYGDSNSGDLVIMAHNYAWHFGKISSLKAGDSVFFTDMDGVSTEYLVVAQDILGPKEGEEMTAGEYDLTLFTCTYDSGSRVTIRCDAA